MSAKSFPNFRLRAIHALLRYLGSGLFVQNMSSCHRGWAERAEPKRGDRNCGKWQPGRDTLGRCSIGLGRHLFVTDFYQPVVARTSRPPLGATMMALRPAFRFCPPRPQRADRAVLSAIGAPLRPYPGDRHGRMPRLSRRRSCRPGLRRADGARVKGMHERASCQLMVLEPIAVKRRTGYRCFLTTRRPGSSVAAASAPRTLRGS